MIYTLTYFYKKRENHGIFTLYLLARLFGAGLTTGSGRF